MNWCTACRNSCSPMTQRALLRPPTRKNHEESRVGSDSAKQSTLSEQLVERTVALAATACDEPASQGWRASRAWQRCKEWYNFWERLKDYEWIDARGAGLAPAMRRLSLATTSTNWCRTNKVASPRGASIRPSAGARDVRCRYLAMPARAWGSVRDNRLHWR